jgi:hypothetical protein
MQLASISSHYLITTWNALVLYCVCVCVFVCEYVFVCLCLVCACVCVCVFQQNSPPHRTAVLRSSRWWAGGSWPCSSRASIISNTTQNLHARAAHSLAFWSACYVDIELIVSVILFAGVPTSARPASPAASLLPLPPRTLRRRRPQSPRGTNPPLSEEENALVAV